MNKTNTNDPQDLNAAADQAEQQSAQETLQDPHEQQEQHATAQQSEQLDETAALQAELYALRQELEQSHEQLRQEQDRTLRAIAEADNARRIAAREREKAAKFAVEPLARELLEVAENLSRALQAVDTTQLDDNAQLKSLYDGLLLVERTLVQAFEKNHIQIINPLGQDFDPNLHQAMGQIPSSDYEAGKVAFVMSRAYCLHERLLRPAMVQVAVAMPQA